jgi:hypothetical protein
LLQKILTTLIKGGQKDDLPRNSKEARIIWKEEEAS